MKQASASPDPTSDGPALAEDLCRALLTPQSPAEMARLLTDLCTPAEVRTLADDARRPPARRNGPYFLS
jgi:uncharacterized protein YerC